MLFGAPLDGTLTKPRTVLFHAGTSSIKQFNFFQLWSQRSVAVVLKHNKEEPQCSSISRKFFWQKESHRNPSKNV